LKACVHLIFAVFLITTISCGQAAQPPKTVQKADSIPPSAPALNATELRRYSGIAGHFWIRSLAAGSMAACWWPRTA